MPAVYPDIRASLLSKRRSPDDFVQGLVEQPERGGYAATPRGWATFHLACVLPNAGDKTDRTRALDLSELEDEPERAAG